MIAPDRCTTSCRTPPAALALVEPSRTAWPCGCWTGTTGQLEVLAIRYIPQRRGLKAAEQLVKAADVMGHTSDDPIMPMAEIGCMLMPLAA